MVAASIALTGWCVALLAPANLPPLKRNHLQMNDAQRFQLTVKMPPAKSDLQAQLEGTENRIAVARKDFNASVKAYNGKVRRFPGSVWAGMFGFDQRDYFESVEGSEAAPTVNFGS